MRSKYQRHSFGSVFKRVKGEGIVKTWRSARFESRVSKLIRSAVRFPILVIRRRAENEEVYHGNQIGSMSNKKERTMKNIP